MSQKQMTKGVGTNLTHRRKSTPSDGAIRNGKHQVRSSHIVRIRPSKFIPRIPDSTSEHDESSDQEDFSGRHRSFRPKWKPSCSSGDDDSGTQYKKVAYYPHVKSRKETPISSLVDQSMQELNARFKSNVSQLSHDLSYNKLHRSVDTKLDALSKGIFNKYVRSLLNKVKVIGIFFNKLNKLYYFAQGTENVENGEGWADSNPLIYFKYDFGYEFGVADPKQVIVSNKEINKEHRKSWPSFPSLTFQDNPSSVKIEIPVIHDKSSPINE